MPRGKKEGGSRKEDGVTVVADLRSREFTLLHVFVSTHRAPRPLTLLLLCPPLPPSFHHTSSPRHQSAHPSPVIIII